MPVVILSETSRYGLHAQWQGIQLQGVPNTLGLRIAACLTPQEMRIPGPVLQQYQSWRACRNLHLPDGRS